MNTKLPLALLAAISATTAMPTSARQQRIVFNDLWDSSWIDDMFEQHRQAMDEMRQHFERQGPSKEIAEAMKKARQNLANVKLDISESDNKAVFAFTGFENLEKKDVEIEKKKWGWAGTITTKDGVIEFVISARGIEIARHAEVKREGKSALPAAQSQKEVKEAKENKEPKAPKETKDAAAAQEAPEAKQVYYSSSYTSEAQSLKQPIDIGSLKVDARTATTLTLSADKIKRETLQIP
jgi:hypothetical protein